jgi:hypothetical protein
MGESHPSNRTTNRWEIEIITTSSKLQLISIASQYYIHSLSEF